MGRGRYKPAAERLSPRPCACGTCGLTISRANGQQSRRWAIGCPNYATIAPLQRNPKTCPQQWVGRRTRLGVKMRGKYGY